MKKEGIIVTLLIIFVLWALAKINIYDVSGKIVNHWVLPHERNIIVWTGTDIFGKPLAASIYFCVMQQSLTENPFYTKLVYSK